MKASFAEALIKIIDTYLQFQYPDAEDKLVMASLAEIKISLMKKTIEIKPEYTISLTPVQALGIQIFYDNWYGTEDKTSYTGNKLMLITNEIKQKFN